MRCFLTFDAGTTSMKVALVGETGEVLGSSTREYDLVTPDTTTAELDAEVYWETALDGARKAIAESGGKAGEITAIAISSQGETLISVDGDGRPLRRAIVWVDNRSIKEAQEIEKHFGLDEVYRVTGQPSVVPTWPATKILWLKRHEPGVFRRTAKFCIVEDFLLHKLTGEWVAERSVHSSSLWMDIVSGKLWPEMLEFLGIGPERLSRITGSGEIVGAVTPKVARELGISSKTMVVTGALDQPAGAIGAGNIMPGVCTETTGAALAVVITLDRPVWDPARRLPCHMHGLPGRKYFLMPWGQTAGLVLKWFRDTFCAELSAEAKSYAALTEEAMRTPAGCEGLVCLPHLTGAASPEFDPYAKGVFYGVSLKHTRGHFVRAIMESVAFMLRKNLELLPALGIAVTEVRALGGGAKSALWNQIKADATGKAVVTVRSTETACVGVAMLAAVATGVYGSLEEAAGVMVRLKDRFEPSPEAACVYDRNFQVYKKLHDALFELFRAKS